MTSVNFDDLKYFTPRSDKPLLDYLPLPLKLLIILLIFPTVLLALVILMLILIEVIKANLLAGYGLTAAYIGVPWLLFRRQAHKEKLKRSALRRFVHVNKWQYGPASQEVETFSQSFADRVTKLHGEIDMSIKGEYMGHRFEVVLGWRAATDGQYNLEMYAPQIFIWTQAAVPTATLVSRKITEGRSFTDRLFVHFKDPQKVSLEGDFDRYFQLYVPRGTHIDALALIAPDFMQVAKDVAQDYTIELSGNIISLTSLATSAFSKKNTEQLFVAAERICRETSY